MRKKSRNVEDRAMRPDQAMRAADGMTYFATGVAPIFGDWASGANGVFAYAAGWSGGRTERANR